MGFITYLIPQNISQPEALGTGSNCQHGGSFGNRHPPLSSPLNPLPQVILCLTAIMVVPSTSLVKTDLGTLLVDYSGDLEMPDAQESWSSEPIFGLGSRLGLDDGFYGDPAYGSSFGQY